jgi:hypothetical protein
MVLLCLRMLFNRKDGSMRSGCVFAFGGTVKIGVLCRIAHSPAVVCFPKGFFSTLLRLNRAGDCIDRVWIEGLTKTGLC